MNLNEMIKTVFKFVYCKTKKRCVHVNPTSYSFVVHLGKLELLTSLHVEHVLLAATIIQPNQKVSLGLRFGFDSND